MSDAPLFQFKNVTVKRGGRRVLSDVNLLGHRAGSLGIIGPNGSGKTTLLQALRGHLPFSGQIHIRGESIEKLNRQQIARLIAVVPQTLDVAFPYTVREWISFGRAPYLRPWQAYSRADHQRVAEVMERFELTDLADQAVDEISGGECRKVFLARALAQDTEIVLLDEPTAGLDPSAQEDLLRLIEDLRQTEQRSFVSVLHDVSLVERCCDTVLGLSASGQMFFGNPDQVLSAQSLEELYQVPWQQLLSDDGRHHWISYGVGSSALGEKPDVG